jgi:acetate kinase
MINTGSSSLKFSVLDAKAEVVLSFGIAERIGKNSDGRITPGSGLACLARDFRAIDPPWRRLCRKLDFKHTETARWVASKVCERWGLGLPTNEELVIAREIDRLVS